MSDSTDSLSRIVLELAREPGHPLGDAAEGYTLVAPLQADGRLDGAAWRDQRDRCRFVRDHAGERASGHLVHGPGGSWRLVYDAPEAGGDEIGFRLADERIQAGEYLSIVRPDGEHPFRVTLVQRVSELAS